MALSTDDVLEIQRVVRSWTDAESATQHGGIVNLVVTTGGTGFARRDFTPEAIAPLLHRHAPGIVHGMRRGRESLFALDPEPIQELKGYLDQVAEQWDQALARLKAFVEK